MERALGGLCCILTWSPTNSFFFFFLVIFLFDPLFYCLIVFDRFHCFYYFVILVFFLCCINKIVISSIYLSINLNVVFRLGTIFRVVIVATSASPPYLLISISIFCTIPSYSCVILCTVCISSLIKKKKISN